MLDRYPRRPTSPLPGRIRCRFAKLAPIDAGATDTNTATLWRESLLSIVALGSTAC
jgi:hypothetical protein